MSEWRGVNLGGWLVLEKWITPSVFAGTTATDEYTLMRQLGDSKLERLQSHRSTFITEEDFKWISDHGLNSVRLPVPHWAFRDTDHFVACIDQVDWVFEMAIRYNLLVLLDIHTAPNSQNGHDHSGQAGKVGWPQDESDITTMIIVVQDLLQRYQTHPQFIGLELMNEPSGGIPVETLTSYYERCQQIAGYAQLIIHDTFDYAKWQSYASSAGFILDSHLYQLFGEADKRLSIVKHIKKAKTEWSSQINESPAPVIIGEWCAELDTKTFRGLDAFERDKAYQAYANAQLNSFASSKGWFYWTLKTEGGGAWSMQECVRRGWLPSDFSGTLG